MALAIFDVFKAHRGDRLLALLKKNGVSVVFVPASCTDKLQPLDQTINKKYKEEIKKHFQFWYSEMIAGQQLRDKNVTEDDECQSVKIDLKTYMLNGSLNVTKSLKMKLNLLNAHLKPSE